MKKILLIFILILGIFAISTNFNVYAKEIKIGDNTGSSENDSSKPIINYGEGQDSYASCSGILEPDALNMIQEILGMIRLIVPIILVILISVDFATAVVSQDNDALSKATKRVTPRLIGAALFFFVPTIVRAILSLDGVSDALVKSDDPFCMPTGSSSK